LMKPKMTRLTAPEPVTLGESTSGLLGIAER
jgi:hypothetical protein